MLPHAHLQGITTRKMYYVWNFTKFLNFILISTIYQLPFGLKRITSIIFFKTYVLINIFDSIFLLRKILPSNFFLFFYLNLFVHLKVTLIANDSNFTNTLKITSNGFNKSLYLWRIYSKILLINANSCLSFLIFDIFAY